MSEEKRVKPESSLPIVPEERDVVRDIETDKKALNFLAVMCDGDARKALTALEVGVLSSEQSPTAVGVVGQVR